MTRCWLALVDERPESADAAAACDGGYLAAWLQRAKPLRGALRADPHLIDPAGEAATISLVLPPPGVRLLFDDPAVQEARRRVLAGAPFDGVTTLLRDASHFEGALTVARGSDVHRLIDDPFARIFPARILEVDRGVLGRMPWPAGPVIERYGSAQPWPADRFA